MSEAVRRVGSAQWGRGWLAIGLLLGAACAGPQNDVGVVSQQEMLALCDAADRPLVLDVRTRAEYDSGHVPCAVNVPHSELGARLPELGGGPGRAVIVYCERGNRARVAAGILDRAGFRNLAYLEGDMTAWRARSLPVAR